MPTRIKGFQNIGFISNLVTVGGGDSHSVALMSDGTVWSWGENTTAGRLGNNSTVATSSPVRVLGIGGVGFLSNIIAIAVGRTHTLALRGDGRVCAWGANASGQLGDNTTANRRTPTNVVGSGGTGFLTNIVAISAGQAHSLALTRNGRVFAWGDNGFGRLGIGTTGGQANSPTQVVNSTGTGPLSNIVAIAAGGSHSLALDQSGQVWAWGNNANGRLGNNSTVNTNRPTLVLTVSGGATNIFNGVYDIAAGESHSLAVKTNGSVWAWGNNAQGRLGDNTTTDRRTPVQVLGVGATGFLQNVNFVSAGDAHSMAIGFQCKVYAWGNNGSGRLGDGTTVNRLSPVLIVQDNVNPVLTIPANVTLECDEPTDPSFTGMATATDNRDPSPSVTYGDTVISGACSDMRTIQRVWMAADNCGNAVWSTQTITVVEITPPALVGVPSNAVADCSAVPLAPTVTAVDNCDTNPSVGFSEIILSGSCPGEYLIRRTWTAVDNCNNEISAVQTVVVHDVISPVIVCPSNVTIACSASIAPTNTGFASATDNCDTNPIVMYTDAATGSCPTIIWRTWTATDFCSNSVSCVQTISVQDVVAPVLIGAPPNTSVVCIVPAPAHVTAADNCDTNVTISFSQFSNGVNPMVVTRVWTATDECGNSAVHTQTIEVAPCSADVSGVLSYSGSQTGMICVVASVTSNAWPTNFHTILAAPGAYTISNVTTYTSYWVRAFRDINGNGVKDGWEAAGDHPSNPIYLTNDVSGVNITLTELLPTSLRVGDVSAQASNAPVITVPNPVFSAAHHHPDGLDAVAYGIQLATDPLFSNLLWNVQGPVSLSAVTNGGRSPDIVYAGAPLVANAYHYWRIRFFDEATNVSSYSAGAASFLYQPPVVDAAINAGDLVLSNNGPATGEVVNISATIRNVGDVPLSNVVVRFYSFGDVIGSASVSIAPGASAVATASVSYASAGVRVIRAVIDPDNLLVENNEANNEASTLLFVGGAGIGARLVVNATVPPPTCGIGTIGISGQAYYEIVTGSFTSIYEVEGAAVSVQIETNEVYASAHTDVNGHFSQYIPVPTVEGQYRLYVRVTDHSIIGQQEITLVVNNSVCSTGSASFVDLVIEACSDLLVSDSSLDVGDTTTVRVVVRNLGNRAASNVVVTLTDVGYGSVGSVVLPLVPGPGAHTGSFTYVASGISPSYRVLHASAAVQPGEQNALNNDATTVLAIGSPTGGVQIVLTGATISPNPAYSGQPVVAGGRADYQIEINGVWTNVPVRGGSVTGNVGSITLQSSTDALGVFRVRFHAPSSPGAYSGAVSVTDCSAHSLQGSAALSLTVVPVPDDVWVYSQDINFGPFNEYPQAPTGYPFTISAVLHVAVTGAYTTPVVIRDIYNLNSNQVVDVLYSNLHTFAGASNVVVSIVYTGRVTGAHVIEVAIEADFGNLSNDEATRTIQIGDPEPVLTVNINRPANGERLGVDPYEVKIRVRDGAGHTMTPDRLALLSVRFDQDIGPYLQDVLLVSNGALVNGATFNGTEFCYTWDPPNHLAGIVYVIATAEDFAGGDGMDNNYVTLDPNPLDVEVLGGEIFFSTNNPAVGQPVGISGVVHNRGFESLSNVLVRFYADNDLIGSATIPSLATGTGEVVQIATTFSNSRVAVIRVFADPLNTIPETDETNNEGTRLLVVGSPGIGARLVVVADVPGAACTTGSVTITGRAYYEIPHGATTNTYPVKGGSVSVQVGYGPVFGGSFTDTSGNFDQFVNMPMAPGQYRLYVTVTDQSLTGQDEVTLVALNDCAPMFLPDLALRACGGLELPGSSFSVGQTATVAVTVWNFGSAPAGNATVRLYDGNALVATHLLASVAAGSSATVAFAYTVPSPDDVYRLLRAEVSITGSELSIANNAATKLIAVGVPGAAPSLVIHDFAAPATAYAGQGFMIAGRARYVGAIHGVTSPVAAAGAQLTGLLGTNVFAGVSDRYGNAAVWMASQTLGTHAVALSADDCSGLVNIVASTGQVTIVAVPGDVWIHSADIVFAPTEVNDTAQTPTNYPMRIQVTFHHAVTVSAAVPIRVVDRYTDPATSNLVSQVIHSEVVPMSGIGVVWREIGYTGTIAGVHIIEAEADSVEGPTSNDKATRALQVGPAQHLLVVNILQPANGEARAPDPSNVVVRVLNEAGIVQTPANLNLLVLDFIRASNLDVLETIVAVTNGSINPLVAGFVGGVFSVSWDPPENVFGTVFVRARAVSLSGGTGEDQNWITLIPRPVDLAVTSADLSFDPASPGAGSNVVISAEIHNRGTDTLTNILVRFSTHLGPLGADIVIASLAGGASHVVALTTNFSSAGARVIRVDVDPLNAIAELDESNNAATRLLIVGIDPINARIVVQAEHGQACLETMFIINGRARYEIVSPGFTNYYDVKGGQVSVEIEDGPTYAGSHTRADGYFTQYAVAPASNGNYTLFVRVTDNSLLGEEQINLHAEACAEASSFDLALDGCADLVIGDSTLQTGETTTVSATVHNVGDLPAYAVEVRLYDTISLIDQQTLPVMAAGGSSLVSFNYTAPAYDDTYRILRVRVVPKPGERHIYNNEASRVIQVGSPTGAPAVVLSQVSTPSPVYVEQGTFVSGLARYDILVEGVRYTNLAVAGGRTFVEILPGTNTGSGATDDIGNAGAGFRAPSAAGLYTANMTAHDCSGLVTSLVSSVDFVVLNAAQDVWVYSEDIKFEGGIDSFPQVVSGTPFRIFIDLRHSLTDPISCPVVVRDIYNDVATSNQIRAVLWSNNVVFSGSGTVPITIPYTGVVEGAHVFEVEIVSPIGPTHNDKATRALQVGDSDLVLTVEIKQPANGITLFHGPNMLRVTVRDDFTYLAPSDLYTLLLNITRPGVAGSLLNVVLVDNGALVNGAGYNPTTREFTYMWNVPDYVTGHVAVAVSAQNFGNQDGQDVNMVVIKAKPVDLKVGAGDLRFGPSRPNVGEAVVFTGVVHNVGSLLVSNVLLRFYANDVPFASQTIPALAAGASAEVVVTQTFGAAGARVIRLMADPLNTIVETNEANNSVTAFLVVGVVPGLDARIIVRSDIPNALCPGTTLNLTGYAYYEIVSPGFTNVYDVEGGFITRRILPAPFVPAGWTDAAGDYAIWVAAPTNPGNYTLIVSVTDFSLQGEEQITLNVTTSACFYGQSHRAELTVDNCGGLVLSTNNPAIGQSVTVGATARNTGNGSAANVSVRLYDMDALVQTVVVPFLGPGASAPVSFNFVPATTVSAFRVIRVEAAPAIDEWNVQDNAVTKVLRVGDPTGAVPVVLSDRHLTTPRFPGQPGLISTRAWYVVGEAPEAVLIPVAGGRTEATLDGVTIGPARTLDSGVASIGFGAPDVAGVYPMTQTVDDCSGWITPASWVTNLVVLPVPGDLWVDSSDIQFEGPINSFPQVATGTVFRIFINLHHQINGVTNVPVVIRDLYNDVLTSNLVADVLYSNNLTFVNGGVVPLEITYTGLVAGAHTIEAIITADDHVPLNNKATRALQVGEANQVLVVEIQQPANGAVLTPDPNLLRVRVRDNSVILNETDLSLLNLRIRKPGQAAFIDVVLVQNGMLQPGVSFDSIAGEFRYIYDAPDNILGLVEVEVMAQDFGNRNGVDVNVITLIPRPIDLVVTASDIAFSTNHPAVNESVIITAIVRNAGTETASNVTVRFFANNNALADATIASLAGGASASTVITASFASAGARVIRVSADPDLQIPETDESNNSATRILLVGPFTPEASVVLTAGVNDPVCPNALVGVFGGAQYRIIAGGQTNFYPMQGALASVQVNAGPTYSDEHTDVLGDYSQLMYAPEIEGAHILTIVITDNSVSGTNQITLIVDDGACPPQRAADLELRSCAGMLLNTNILAIGQTATVSLTVRNVGSTSAPNVRVRFFDHLTEIDSRTISVLNAGGHATVIFNYVADGPNDSYRLLRATVDPVASEMNLRNNEATKVLGIGVPPAGGARIVVTGLSVPSPLYPGEGRLVSGVARYEIDGVTTNHPAQSATVSVQITNVFSGALTDVNGRGSQGVAAPSVTGAYSVVMTADDCSGLVSILAATGTMQVVPIPFGGDVWVHSQDIRFDGAIDGNPQVPTGAVFNIYITMHHAVNMPTNAVVEVKDVYFDCLGGVFVTNLLGSTNVSFNGAGAKMITVPYTARVEAAHIIQAVIEANFGDLSNDHAGRLLQVGQPSTALTVNILNPTNNAEIMVNPQTVRVSALDGAAVLAPSNLAFLSVEFRKTPVYQQTIPVVNNGALVTGSFDGVVYEFSWDPPDSLSGAVTIRAQAEALDCDGGVTAISVAVIGYLPPDILGVPPAVTVECDAIPPVPTNVTAVAYCGDATNVYLSFSQNSTGACPAILTRTWVATDTCGLVSTSKQVITVVDTTTPVIKCPSNLTLTCTNAVPPADTNSVIASDNCGAPLVTLEETTDNGGSGCAGDPRIITRIYRATDACGNYAQCTQTIVIVDNVPPSLTGVPASTNITCGVVAPPPTVTADDCGVSRPVSFSETTNGLNPVIYTRVWSATDDCGNSVTVTQVITAACSDPVKNLTTGATYPAIQPALSAAASGHMIAIQQGTYAITSTLTLVSGVSLFGGCNGGFVRVGGPETTVLDGQNSVRVFYGSGLSAGTELSFFTIQNGFAGTNYNADGSALKLEGGSAAVVHDVVFLANASAPFQVYIGEVYGGGAVSVRFSSPTFANCSFLSNGVIGGVGGAMRNYYSSPTITKCVFDGNQAVGGEGAAMHNTFSSPRLRDVVFRDQNGMAFNAHARSHPTIMNALFYNNATGAVAVSYSSSLDLTNVTFTANGPALTLDWAANVNAVNNIVFGNTSAFAVSADSSATVNYSMVEGGYAGTGNLSADPLFANGAAGDVHLQAGSPAIDAGSASASSLGLSGSQGYGTHTDGVSGDSGQVDMGYHYDGYSP